MSYENQISIIDSFYKAQQSNINKKYTYIVPMFPYPSGNIHMGHVRVYTITNAIAQYFKSKGENVVHPIGFDSFGSPAENAAIKNNVAPAIWTKNNINKMKSDFQAIGFDFDWNACVQTSDPKYYKFEQEIFKKAWENNVIYKKDKYVNYDPVDKTVLSNEQVINGKGWRSGAEVIRKKIPMYFFDMKKYAKELFNDLEKIQNNWPKQVIQMQKNWIDYQVGNYYRYKINNQFIDVFKKIEDFNCIIIGINNTAVDIFKNQEFNIWSQDNEKGGVSQKTTFKESKFYDTHYFVNFENKQIPIFIDMNRDDEIIFAKSPIKGTCTNIASFDSIKEGEFIGLKDWCISRQKYWGNPIPVVHCEDCGDVLEPNFVELPTDLIPKVGNILDSSDSFKNCNCPKCNKPAKRSTDTMDTFVQSSWYFHNYITKMNGSDYGITNKDTQIDYYVGGIEHATMHLIYARFFHKMLRDFGYVSTDEPIKKLITQGMVCKKYVNEQGKTISTKMSKSIGNIVEPQEYVDKYGSDALQMFMIFAAPPNQNFDFDSNGIIGCYRFLEEIYQYFFIGNNSIKINNQEDAKKAVENLQFRFDNEFNNRFNINTLIPELMKTFKIIKRTDFVDNNIKKDVELTFVNNLGIFAPKIAYYLKDKYFMINQIKTFSNNSIV